MQIQNIQDLLFERCIEPSLLVIAGHGSEGSIDMGGISLGYKGGLSLKDSGLLSIAQTMKADNDGNCSIIFESCSQDAPSEKGEDDTTLTQVAADIRNMTKQDDARKNYMIYGVDRPYVPRSFNGIILAKKRGDDGYLSSEEMVMSRVVLTKSGSILRHLREGASDQAMIKLPMLTKFIPPTE